jgi:hypothetical protein
MSAICTLGTTRSGFIVLDNYKAQTWSKKILWHSPYPSHWYHQQITPTADSQLPANILLSLQAQSLNRKKPQDLHQLCENEGALSINREASSIITDYIRIIVYLSILKLSALMADSIALLTLNCCQYSNRRTIWQIR